MTEKEVLKVFKEENALLEGHFLLSSGLHSGQYLQCALVLQKPWLAEKLCRALAAKLKALEVDAVIGPALGGMIVSHEMGRALKVRSLFAERLPAGEAGVDGEFALRRGFSLKENEKLLVVEDVVTTGKSTKEVIGLLEKSGAKAAAVASIVDRSADAADFTQPFHSLLKMELRTYPPEDCPLCREGKIPVTKPGSRGLKAAALGVSVLLGLSLFANASFAADQQNSAAVEQAKQDYRAYLEQLKAASRRYKEVTGQIKEVVKDEGLPVWDEETGEIRITQGGLVESDVKETDRTMTVSLDLPGLKKETIRTVIQDATTLKITGERKDDKEPKEIERLIALPAPARDEGATAKYEDGVLTVTILKAPQTKKEVVVPLH